MTWRVIRLRLPVLQLRALPWLPLPVQLEQQVQRAPAEPRVALVEPPVEVVALVVLADKVGAALTRAAARISRQIRGRVSRYELARAPQQRQPPVLRLAQLL
jgi:hypothetical protein